MTSTIEAQKCLSTTFTSNGLQTYDSQAFIKSQFEILRQIEAENNQKPALKTILTSFTDKTLNDTKQEDFHADIDPFHSILSDPDLLHEQRSLYAKLQSNAKRDPDRYSSNATLPVTTKKTNDLLPVVKQRDVSGTQNIAHCQESTRSRSSRRTLDARPRSNGKDTTEIRDHTTTLTNGKKLRIKGTQHVYKSIARGTALLVQCACCQMISQVEAGTKALYCVSCQSVSPVDQNQFSYLSSHSDGAVAKIVQQQEVDVACARKWPSCPLLARDASVEVANLSL